LAIDYAYAPWLDWDLSARLENGLELLAYMDAPWLQSVDCARKFKAKAVHGWALESEFALDYDWLLASVTVVNALQALDVLSYRAGSFHQAKGRWPVGPAELPQLRDLPDPFTGQPFITRIKEGHLELISVGSDGREDADKSVQRTDKDIVVRL
jgi:hypothetical protein